MTAFLSFNKQVSGVWTQPPLTQAQEEQLKQKLPLGYTWVIWEQMMQTADGKHQAQYSDATRKVAQFNTVQDFWRFWNHLPQPSELLEQKKMVRDEPDGNLSMIDALMIFREGIKPEWEDKANASGGHLQFQLKGTTGPGQIDEYWNNLVLGMVGSTIEPAHIITGIRLVDKLAGRTGFIRLEVWFKDIDNKADVAMLQKSVEKTMSTRITGEPSVAPKCDIKSHAKH